MQSPSPEPSLETQAVDLLDKKAKLVSEGDLLGALYCIRQISELNGDDGHRQQVSFLVAMLNDKPSAISPQAMLSELAYLLEDPAKQDDFELAKPHLDQMLILARKTNDLPLIRRVTLLILKTP